jgi:diguanylate cyclase (GGDEF)-like protein
MQIDRVKIIRKVREFLIPESSSIDNRETIKVMRVIFLFTLLTLMALFLFNLSWKQTWINQMTPIAIALFLVIWWIMERGQIQIAVFMVALFLDVMAVYGGTYGFGLHDIIIVVFPGTIIVTSLILNRRWMLILNGITIVMVGWLGFSEKISSIPRSPLIPGDIADFLFVSSVIMVSSIWAMVISEQNRRNLDKIHFDAMHDYLTGLPNRPLLFDRIDRIIRQRQRDPEQHFAILFIDLDGFKLVNDSLGHRMGDELIIAVANRIKEILRNADTIARMGGDEFILLLSHLKDDQDSLMVAERVQEVIQTPFILGNESVCISASIGIVFGTGYEKADDLLIDADLAMYRAKKLGKGRFEVFEASMREIVKKEKIASIK